MFSCNSRLPPIPTLFPYTTLFRSNMVKKCTKTTHSHDSRDSNYSNSVDGIDAVVSRIRALRSNVMWENCETTARSEEHTSELQSRRDLVCRLLLEKKKIASIHNIA